MNEVTNGTGAGVAVADAAALAAASERMSAITLENGIVLRLKPVPPLALRAASAHLPRPEVPIVEIPERDRSEPNPSDPDYLEALDKWRNDLAEAALTVALVLGTEIEHVPDGIITVEDDRWINDLLEAHALTGAPDPLVIRRDGKGRYLDWLRMYAIPSNMDYFRLTRVLTTGVALTEAEVQAAADSFRSLYVRPADLFRPIAAAAPDRGDDPATG